MREIVFDRACASIQNVPVTFGDGLGMHSIMSRASENAPASSGRQAEELSCSDREGQAAYEQGARLDGGSELVVGKGYEGGL